MRTLRHLRSRLSNRSPRSPPEVSPFESQEPAASSSGDTTSPPILPAVVEPAEGRSGVASSDTPAPDISYLHNDPSTPITQSATAGSNVKNAVCNALKTTLQIFYETLDSVPAPGLKGAIGGALKVVEKLDVADQNRKEFAELTKRIEKLNDALSGLRAWPSMKISGELADRIRRASEELDEVDKDIKFILDRSKFRGLIHGPDDTRKVIESFRKIKNSIDILVGESALRTEVIAWTHYLRSVLNNLPRAEDARWDYVRGRTECLKETRTAVLATIEAWVVQDDARPVYWLNGLAGTGKTTIAQSMARFAAEKSLLGASFFCSRDEDKRSNVALIIPTLAFQLTDFDPHLGPEITKAIVETTDIGHAPLEVQLRRLIIEPYQRLNAQSRADPLAPTNVPAPRVLIIIDALDECKDANAPTTILNALSQCLYTLPFLKVFVASRPEYSARDIFQDELLERHSKILVLHNVHRDSVDGDIRHFLAIRLKDVAKHRNVKELPAEWPLQDLLDKLVQKAAGLFIYASTICRFLSQRGNFQEQLDDIVKLSDTAEEGRLGIDDLYQTVFDAALGKMHWKAKRQCRSIIGAIILLKNPLSLDNLSNVLGLKPDFVRDILEDFHSVLVIPPREDGQEVIRTIHASFHDFLTDEMRCRAQDIFVQPEVHHREITLGLLKFVLTEDTDEDVGQSLSLDHWTIINYFCEHWFHHWGSASANFGADGELAKVTNMFLRVRFAYWLEYSSNGILRDDVMTTTIARKFGLWLAVTHFLRDNSSDTYLAAPHATYIACEAAAAALMVNDNERALWSLDHGHLVYLRFKAQQTRDPGGVQNPDNFSAIDAGLYRQLEDLYQQHMTIGYERHFIEFSSLPQLQLLHRRWADQRETLVSQLPAINHLPMLCSTRLLHPLSASQGRIVVMLNASDFRYDALILGPSQPLLHVPLVCLSQQRLIDMCSIVEAKPHWGSDHPHGYPLQAPRIGGIVPSYFYRDNSNVRDVLESLWKWVVKPILDGLRLQKYSSESEEIPRIWWCTSGDFVYLPIHSAGIYNSDGTTVDSLSDYAVSSYIPSLTTLLNTLERPAPKSQDLNILVVAHAALQSDHPIPGVMQEIRCIKDMAASQNIAYYCLEDECATGEAVRNRIHDCSWIHIACHSSSSHSTGYITLWDAYRAITNPPQHADFAYISTCGHTKFDTRSGSRLFPNYLSEGHTLADAILHAGFRGTVTSMWPIQDEDGCFVAERVYTELFHAGVPDSTKVARALHNAVQQLRKKNGALFMSWVPFIHAGV